jgi:hypothetical protein
MNTAKTTRTAATTRTAWITGNKAGEGYAVGYEDQDINTIVELGELVIAAEADDDVAVYRRGALTIAVGDVYGPWAVNI